MLGVVRCVQSVPVNSEEKSIIMKTLPDFSYIALNWLEPECIDAIVKYPHLLVPACAKVLHLISEVSGNRIARWGYGPPLPQDAKELGLSKLSYYERWLTPASQAWAQEHGGYPQLAVCSCWLSGDLSLADYNRFESALSGLEAEDIDTAIQITLSQLPILKWMYVPLTDECFVALVCFDQSSPELYERTLEALKATDIQCATVRRVCGPDYGPWGHVVAGIELINGEAKWTEM